MRIIANEASVFRGALFLLRQSHCYANQLIRVLFAASKGNVRERSGTSQELKGQAPLGELREIVRVHMAVRKIILTIFLSEISSTGLPALFKIKFSDALDSPAQ